MSKITTSLDSIIKMGEEFLPNDAQYVSMFPTLGKEKFREWYLLSLSALEGSQAFYDEFKVCVRRENKAKRTDISVGLDILRIYRDHTGIDEP